MFDKEYKNAMDSVNIDEQKRDEILDKIILKEELKEHGIAHATLELEKTYEHCHEEHCYVEPDHSHGHCHHHHH